MEADPLLARRLSSGYLARSLNDTGNGLFDTVERVGTMTSGFRLDLPHKSSITNALPHVVWFER